MNLMKAVRIHEYGSAAVLHFEDAPVPDIASGDVLIRVLGSSVNPVDWKLREGHLRSMLTPTLPFTLGWDVSGVVHAVGANARRFKVGDAVYSRPDIAATAATPSSSRCGKAKWRSNRPPLRTCRRLYCRWRASRPGKPSLPWARSNPVSVC